MRSAIIGLISGVVIGASLGSKYLPSHLVNPPPPFGSISVKVDNTELRSVEDDEKAFDDVVKSIESVISPSTEDQNNDNLAGESLGETLKKSFEESFDENLEQSLKPIHWKVAGTYPGDVPLYGSFGLSLAKNIHNLSAGLINFQYNEPGVIVEAGKEYKAVQSGSIEAAFMTPGEPQYNAITLQLFSSIPFGPSIRPYLAWAGKGEGREIFDSINHRNLVHGIICGVVPASAGGWFTKEVESRADLSNLSMRINGFGAMVLEEMGVNTVQMAAADIGAALDSGIIDGAEYAQPTADMQLGLNEHASYYYFPGWHKPATLLELIINLDKWNSLIPLQQQAIVDACNSTIEQGLIEGDAAQYEALKELTLQGIKIKRWPDELLDQFRQTWEKVRNEQAAKNVEFKKTWKSLIKFQEEFEIWEELKLYKKP